jgi:hypothetical protein
MPRKPKQNQKLQNQQIIYGANQTKQTKPQATYNAEKK